MRKPRTGLNLGGLARVLECVLRSGHAQASSKAPRPVRAGRADRDGGDGATPQAAGLRGVGNGPPWGDGRQEGREGPCEGSHGQAAHADSAEGRAGSLEFVGSATPLEPVQAPLDARAGPQGYAAAESGGLDAPLRDAGPDRRHGAGGVVVSDSAIRSFLRVCGELLRVGRTRNAGVAVRLGRAPSVAGDASVSNPATPDRTLGSRLRGWLFRAKGTGGRDGRRTQAYGWWWRLISTEHFSLASGTWRAHAFEVRDEQTHAGFLVLANVPVDSVLMDDANFQQYRNRMPSHFYAQGYSNSATINGWSGDLWPGRYWVLVNNRGLVAANVVVDVFGA